MAYKGNISFQLFECEYNDLYDAYIIDDDIKDDVQVLVDYYTDSGYYLVLNEAFWKNLINFTIHEKEFDIHSPSLESINISFDELRNIINDFSEFITKQSNLNVHALFNMVNIKRLSLFNDFMKVFFNKQNKKVKKSFLQSHGMYGLEDYYNESRRYEYFTMFEEYFGNKFTNFVDNELEKHGINEKFSTLKVVDEIFSKFSNNQLLAFINRSISNNANLMLFNPYLVFNGDEFIFVFMWDESKKEFEDFEVLWIDFLLTLGFDVEIFAFNKSHKTLSRFVNRFRANKFKLELSNFNEEFKLKSDIDNFKQLKSKLASFDKENNIIKLDGEKVNFDEVNDIFSCTCKKEDNALSKDYCCGYGELEPATFPCKYIEEYFSFIFNVGEGFSQITDDGILKFDKNKVMDKLKDLSKTMKICPFFDYIENKKVFTKYLRNINPKTMTQWCFVDEKGHTWYFLRKVWFNDGANLDFPGFSKMTGVKKTDFDVKQKAVNILDQKLKDKNQKSLLDFK